MADRPVHEIRLGRVKAAIWRNEGENGARHNVTISRIYKTEAGWESSTSFGRDELPLVAKVADLAHTWLFQQGEHQESSSPPPTEHPTGAQGRRTRGSAR